MSAQRPQGTCPHHQSGGPPVCSYCVYISQAQAGNLSLSPQQLVSLQRYVQATQAQGRRDLAAVYSQHIPRGEGWIDGRSVANNVIGSSTPGQLPDSYPYPTSIDTDVPNGSVTPVAGSGSATGSPRPSRPVHGTNMRSPQSLVNGSGLQNQVNNTDRQLQTGHQARLQSNGTRNSNSRSQNTSHSMVVVSRPRTLAGDESEGSSSEDDGGH